MHQPELERQVVVGALLEALVGVHVGVDEAGHDDGTPRVDDLDLCAARRFGRHLLAK